MDLRNVLQVLRTTWLSIVVITVAGALIAFIFAVAQPKSYRANASGIIQAGNSSDLGGALAGENLAKSRVKSYLDVAHSRSVARRVIEDLGLDTTPEALVTTVSAVNPIDTAVIQITVSAPEPELAAEVAEAWIAGIAAEVREIENTGAAEGSESIIHFRSLDSAVVPRSPSSPNIKLITAIGLAAGLVLGVAQAFVRAVLDRRIRRPEQVESELGLSVLGSVPRHPAIDDGRRIADAGGGQELSARTDDTSFAVSESLRELRTNLRFMNVDDPPRVITITSSLPGEGKSTVAANLARTIAQGGEPVILVDGDLRRPTVAKTFGVLPGIGLTDVLVGNAEIDDVLQEASGDGKLQVLGAGVIPPNPSELLGSQAMKHTLEALAEKALVLIDAPPLLPVTDAAVLSMATDGAVLVGRCGKTTVDTVEQALQNIERIRGRALGFIINAVPLRGSRSYTYKYRYSSSYRSRQPADDDEPRRADHGDQPSSPSDRRPGSHKVQASR